jgi:serine/threonine-protein kinase
MRGMAVDAQYRPGSVDDWLSLLPDLQFEGSIAETKPPTHTAATVPVILPSPPRGEALAGKNLGSRDGEAIASPVPEARNHQSRPSSFRSTRSLFIATGIAIASGLAIALSSVWRQPQLPNASPVAQPESQPQNQPQEAQQEAQTVTPESVEKVNSTPAESERKPVEVQKSFRRKSQQRVNRNVPGVPANTSSKSSNSNKPQSNRQTNKNAGQVEIERREQKQPVPTSEQIPPPAASNPQPSPASEQLPLSPPASPQPPAASEVTPPFPRSDRKPTNPAPSSAPETSAPPSSVVVPITKPETQPQPGSEKKSKPDKPDKPDKADKPDKQKDN